MSKKIVAVLLMLSLFSCLTVGCSSKEKEQAEQDEVKQAVVETTEEPVEGVDINIACMKGPTGIGMIQLLSESDAGNTVNHYNHSIVGTADEVSAGLINGSLDMAAVPCNLASVLYQKTQGEIVTVAVNTLGVLYVVENGESINRVEDLTGKTIYSTGQGTTPEYTLRYLLTTAGIDPDQDVTIEYKSEATEVVAAMAQNPDAIAMLPQPYVTVAMNNNENLRIALDVTEEWEKSCDSTVVTGVLVAKKSFIEEKEAAFKVFLDEYKASTDFANRNVDETAALLEKYDVFKAAIAKKAIPYCNVTCITGEEMKEDVLAYLTVLYNQNPSSIGGKLPDEGMFYLE